MSESTKSMSEPGEAPDLELGIPGDPEPYVEADDVEDPRDLDASDYSDDDEEE